VSKYGSPFGKDGTKDGFIVPRKPITVGVLLLYYLLSLHFICIVYKFCICLNMCDKVLY